MIKENKEEKTVYISELNSIPRNEIWGKLESLVKKYPIYDYQSWEFWIDLDSCPVEAARYLEYAMTGRRTVMVTRNGEKERFAESARDVEMAAIPVGLGDGEEIKLDNGGYLIKHYGKFRSGLTLLSDVPMKQIEVASPHKLSILSEELNIDVDAFDSLIMYGDFFVSRKGSKCFRVKKNGKHMLLRFNIGRDFSVRHWGPDQEVFEGKELYWREAMSNGGGTGYLYIVIPRGWRKSWDIDEI
jgi:hypothetical protein